MTQIIRPDDHMILSEEGPSSLGSCYVSSFHLSDESTFSSARFGLNYSSAEYYHSSASLSTTDPTYPSFFHGNTILNWGMFARPGHPVLATTVGNIVSILSNEHYRASVVAMTRWDKKWKQLFCSTGFTLTYTIREMALGEQLMHRCYLSVGLVLDLVPRTFVCLCHTSYSIPFLGCSSQRTLLYFRVLNLGYAVTTSRSTEARQRPFLLQVIVSV
jgi:hypothetical protein